VCPSAPLQTPAAPLAPNFNAPLATHYHLNLGLPHGTLFAWQQETDIKMIAYLAKGTCMSLLTFPARDRQDHRTAGRLFDQTGLERSGLPDQPGLLANWSSGPASCNSAFTLSCMPLWYSPPMHPKLASIAQIKRKTRGDQLANPPTMDCPAPSEAIQCQLGIGAGCPAPRRLQIWPITVTSPTCALRGRLAKTGTRPGRDHTVGQDSCWRQKFIDLGASRLKRSIRSLQ